MLRAAIIQMPIRPLLYFYAAEAAVAFEVEGLGAIGGLGAAVAVDSGKGGVDVVADTDALADSDLHAAKAAVDDDDGSVADVGIAQVEAHEAEAGVHVGAVKNLAIVAVVLFAEGDIDFVHLASVKNDRFGLFAVGAGLIVLLVEEQQHDAPYHGDDAYHILPHIVPGDDAASGQQQQYADAEADDGAGLVSVVEDVDEAGHDDEERPPAFEADADDVEEFQGPHDAEGQKGDASDDFACSFHCLLVYKTRSRP